MENYLTVQTASGPMAMFLAARESSEAMPVVIVLQEAFGVNSHIKDVCLRLAAQGYLALAPELFHREALHLTFDYTEKDRYMPYLGKLTNQGLLEDVASCIVFLKMHPFADHRNIFTLGFCMGGFTSLLAATVNNLRGAISFYGAGVVQERAGIGFKPFVEQLKFCHCPLLLFFGESDISISEADRFAIRTALESNHVPHEMQVFGKSDHGFFCDERKTYNSTSASLAWNKCLGWMKNLQVID